MTRLSLLRRWISICGLYDPEKSSWLEFYQGIGAATLYNGSTDGVDFTGKEELLRIWTFTQIEGFEPTINAPAIPGFSKLRVIWHEYLQKAYLGEMTPAEARDKMQEEGQATIDEFKKW